MTKIFNGTPHSINVVNNGTFDASIRKFVTDTPDVVVSIPSNGVLSAKIDTRDGDPIFGIPTFKKAITGFDPIPDGYDIVIVSALYASAAMANGQDMSKIFTIADPVYSTDGKTIHGCRGISPFM
jgi:hypothetical protein